MKKYRIVEFKVVENGINLKKRGHKIGDYLAVTFYYSISRDVYGIFKLKGGGLATKIEFACKTDAIQFAEMLEKNYRGFLPIWDAGEDLNIFKMARWSIPGGHKIWSIIEILEQTKRPIKLSEIKDIVKQAKAQLKKKQEVVVF